MNGMHSIPGRLNLTHTHRHVQTINQLYNVCKIFEYPKLLATYSIFVPLTFQRSAQPLAGDNEPLLASLSFRGSVDRKKTNYEPRQEICRFIFLRRQKELIRSSQPKPIGTPRSSFCRVQPGIVLGRRETRTAERRER